MTKIKLTVINMEFAVCKITSIDEADFCGEYVFISKTKDELSLVCEAGRVPPFALKCEHGFSMLKINGSLDFGLLGVISGITGTLAESGISVFVVSTYETDYILVRRESLGNAVKQLQKAGYAVDGSEQASGAVQEL